MVVFLLNFVLLIVVLSACAWTCAVSEEWPSSAEALRDAIVKLERCHFFFRIKMRSSAGETRVFFSCISGCQIRFVSLLVH